jgi:hypothetical protein
VTHCEWRGSQDQRTVKQGLRAFPIGVTLIPWYPIPFGAVFLLQLQALISAQFFPVSTSLVSKVIFAVVTQNEG